MRTFILNWIEQLGAAKTAIMALIRPDLIRNKITRPGPAPYSGTEDVPRPVTSPVTIYHHV